MSYCVPMVLLLAIMLACGNRLAAQSGNTVAVTATPIAIHAGSSAEGSDSTRLSEIKQYYTLAKQYKDGDGAPIDYAKAFYYFSKAAALGDAQSIYALAYFHFKGIGASQDYNMAARLFSEGAYAGRDNSMYFYALCFRNGYGLAQNEDSAKYWLNKAAALGYKQAIQELQMPAPENSNDSARKLVQQIHSAALPEQAALNQFIAVTHHIPDSSVIEGEYQGYVIQYDWSGNNPVSSRKLGLIVSKTTEGTETLEGSWLEEGTDSVNLKASLKKDSLVFADTHYRRKDHYSPDSAILYNFENASLNLVRKGDSVFLAGNIYMFSPDRKEPSKPLFVALTRTTASTEDSSVIKKQNNTLTNTSSQSITVKLLNVYPNPFSSYVNVAFEVNKASSVGIDLYNMAGQLVYQKAAQPLGPGRYTIRVEPPNQLPTQAYLLRLVFNGGQQVFKVIKK